MPPRPLGLRPLYAAGAETLAQRLFGDIARAGEAGEPFPLGGVYNYSAYMRRPEWQLFDVRADPLCQRDLAAEPARGERAWEPQGVAVALSFPTSHDSDECAASAAAWRGRRAGRGATQKNYGALFLSRSTLLVFLGAVVLLYSNKILN